MRVAILQRDLAQANLLEQAIIETGHCCLKFTDGLSLSAALGKSNVHLVVLDWHAPALSGADLLSSLRYVRSDRLPVIFASADVSEESVVRALACGADDYVALPLRRAEFRERLSAVLRRAYPEETAQREFCVGPYEFEPSRQMVKVDGMPVFLSLTQYRLALMFFSNLDKVLSREHIFSVVWGRELRAPTRTIDSTVSKLRALLQIEEQHGFRLQPVYKNGYRLMRLKKMHNRTPIAALAAA
jgi:DNA-binding response OmpR family regulator